MRTAGGCNIACATAALIYPPLNLADVGACLNAELRSEDMTFLVQVTLVEADLHSSELGQQVTATGGQFYQLSKRRGASLPGEPASLAGVPGGSPGYAG